MRTNEEFQAQVNEFHAEIQNAAEEWSAWRKRMRRKRSARVNQPTSAELMVALQQILAEIASLKQQRAAA